MRRILRQRNSIVYRLTIFAIIIIVIQSLFLIAVLVNGGVLRQAKLNAYESFSDKVQGRKAYLELEMKNRWTNVDPFLSQISKKLSKTYETDTLLLDSLSSELIEMLRTTKATGAFILLTDDINDNNVPGLYFRDYDPLSDNLSFKDLYVVVGPSEIAKKLKVPLDQMWSYDLRLTSDNQDFIKRPLNLANLSNDPKLLGYWSKPFKLSDTDLQIMTYSMPIFDSENNLKGIVGIEVTLNHMIKMLPATDLKLKDSLGYILTHKPTKDSKPIPSVIVSALQKRYLVENEPLNLLIENEDFGIYKLLNHSGSYDIYASVEELKLYQPNTPFEGESWYLVGFMRGEELFSYVYRTQSILWGAFIIALIVGIFGGVYFSYRFSKPIVDLSKKVRESNKNEIMIVEPTGLLEVDELAQAMQEANNERLESVSRLTRVISLFDLPIAAFEIKNNSDDIFVTEKLYTILDLDDKNKVTFMNKLNELLNNPEENEEGVYKINLEYPRWVKLKMTDSSDTTIGVIQDITEETKEKLQIRRDRDIDPLTRLLNRRAFQSCMEQLLNKNPLKSSALVMFDLDNLKNMNDTYGHKWGDFYIKEAVQRLNNITQRNKMLLGRRSGDEFVLLLYGFTSKQEIEDCMNEFFLYIKGNTIKLPDGKDYSIGISAGLTWIDSWPTDYEDLLNKADEALYISKFNNKGNWTKL